MQLGSPSDETCLTCRISNFDNSVQRIKMWISDRQATPSPGQALSPSSSSAQLVGLGLTMAAGLGNSASQEGGSSANAVTLTSSQRKRIKAYLKRCRMNPRHSQLNLEGYLLLPVQRIPRYRLLVSAVLGCDEVHVLTRVAARGTRPEQSADV